MNHSDRALAAALAKAVTALCVRNTFLEDLHSGTTPSSKTGDYSDVKVVTPFGEIPWCSLSRISDAEMKRLMKEVVDKIFTFLCRQEDPAFLDAVKATGRKRLVMCGLVTSICLAYSAVSALADGYEVAFVANAVADTTKEQHDTALVRLAHAGAIPNTSPAIISEWFRDWNLPSADVVRRIYPPFFEEWAALKRAPEHYEPKGLA